MDWAAWGVSWLGAWGDSWGPLYQVEESPRRGGQSPGPRRAYPQGRRRRIQLTSGREEARRRALRRDEENILLLFS